MERVYNDCETLHSSNVESSIVLSTKKKKKKLGKKMTCKNDVVFNKSVKMAKWFKVPDSSSGLLKRTWFKILLLTSTFTQYF